MLRAGEHVRVADLAMVIVVRRVKSYIISLAVYFQLDRLIRRILHRRDISVIRCADAENRVTGTQRN